MLQSVFTSAREKLEKEGFAASSSDSETEEEESSIASTSKGGKGIRDYDDDDDEGQKLLTLAVKCLFICHDQLSVLGNC